MRTVVFGAGAMGTAVAMPVTGRGHVGVGEAPDTTLHRLEAWGLTVEGINSTREVARLADERNLDLPYHAAIHRVLFDGADARDILEVLR